MFVRYVTQITMGRNNSSVIDKERFNSAVEINLNQRSLLPTNKMPSTRKIMQNPSTPAENKRIHLERSPITKQKKLAKFVTCANNMVGCPIQQPKIQKPLVFCFMTCECPIHPMILEKKHQVAKSMSYWRIGPVPSVRTHRAFQKTKCSRHFGKWNTHSKHSTFQNALCNFSSVIPSKSQEEKKSSVDFYTM